MEMATHGGSILEAYSINKVEYHSSEFHPLYLAIRVVFTKFLFLGQYFRISPTIVIPVTTMIFFYQTKFVRIYKISSN
jgi:hypothetical protein